MTHTRLSLLSCAIVFYYYYHKLVLWYLDQVPPVPKLTEQFEEIIELDTSRIPVVTHPDDEELFPFPMMGGATIVIKGPMQGPLLHHLGQMLW